MICKINRPLFLIVLATLVVQNSYAVDKSTTLSSVDQTTLDASSLSTTSESQVTETRSTASFNSFLDAIDEEAQSEPISFIISKVDIGTIASNHARNVSIPIIMPAAAQLTLPHEIPNMKRKKNLSKIAKSIIIASKNIESKKNNTNLTTETTTATTGAF